ncbi:alpha/beta fold hydrolase [Umezawaea beigongshangensis]|uniref:alpha/beta fold hydrolase n=1 Tax=Umezawaea beigongshangensis TaxID=2780383 RepID=UPI0018F11A47|nr:alpha/beta hydrolase [Umezawaea beigongshangensis]
MSPAAHETDHGTLSVRWTDVGGLPVRSLVAGRRRAPEPEVVVVPGLGALGYLLDTVAGCGARTRSHLLDVPGFGHRGPRAPARIPALAGVVAGWLDAVADAPVVLVGHSTGAQVALRVAAEHPSAVASLVLLGPTFPPSLRGVPALVGAFLRTAPHERLRELPSVLPYYARGGPLALARMIRSGQRDEPEAVIERVSCPVLVVRGKHDACSPRSWTERLAAAAGGRAVTVPGAHAFPHGRGGLTSALIAGAPRSS